MNDKAVSHFFLGLYFAIFEVIIIPDLVIIIRNQRSERTRSFDFFIALSANVFRYEFPGDEPGERSFFFFFLWYVCDYAYPIRFQNLFSERRTHLP